MRNKQRFSDFGKLLMFTTFSTFIGAVIGGTIDNNLIMSGVKDEVFFIYLFSFSFAVIGVLLGFIAFIED